VTISNAVTPVSIRCHNWRNGKLALHALSIHPLPCRCALRVFLSVPDLPVDLFRARGWVHLGCMRGSGAYCVQKLGSTLACDPSVTLTPL
jgi:hypothetical protein